MLDANTKKACKDDPSIREIKIRNIEHAIEQAELMIKESKMSQEELIFLKRKISDSRQDLEILYLMKIQWKKYSFIKKKDWIMLRKLICIFEDLKSLKIM